MAQYVVNTPYMAKGLESMALYAVVPLSSVDTVCVSHATAGGSCPPFYSLKSVIMIGGMSVCGVENT